MRFIYYSMPGYGHVHPTLSLTRELVNNGHQVIYYCTKHFQKLIEEAGAEFREYPFKEDMDGNLTRDVGGFVNKLATLSETKLEGFIEAAEKEAPDCIIHDALAVWGKLIAQKLEVPGVACITTVAYNRKIFFTFPRLYPQIIKHSAESAYPYLQAYKIYSTLAKAHGLKLNGIGDILTSKEKLNLVFTSKVFQPMSSTFNKTFRFVGPALSSRKQKDTFWKQIDPKKKLIYISYGTLVNDDITFYKRCVAALRETKHQAIMALGSRFTTSDLPPLPRSIIARSYVNQLEVLQKASVFITHAGMNSIMESLTYGVPLLMIPDTYEQTFNALRVQQLGAGIYLNKNQVTPEKILEAVEMLLSNKSYKQKASQIGASLQASGGAKRAVSEIEQYLAQ